MAEGERIKVTLRWLQILDKKEPIFKETGEFVFTTRISTKDMVQEARLPEEGHYNVTDHPRWNTLKHLNKVLFEGEPGETLTVEMFGTELDRFTEDDHLEPYKRVFDGPVEAWLGRHQPRDEGSDDPENLSDWRIAYDIERA